MRPQRFADSGRFVRTGAMLQCIAGRRADAGQVVFADGLLLCLAIRVDRAAHRVIAGKGFGGGNAHAGHRHHEPAVRAGRQGFHQIAHAPHAAGAAHQGKRHISPDARTDGAQLTHRKLCAVQFVQTDQHPGGIGTAAGHAGPHRYPLVDRHIHACQQTGIGKEGQRGLDSGVFIVGRHKAAGQIQRQVMAAAQRDFFIQVNGLHDHIQIMVAVGQRAHDIQRQIQLGRGQHRHRTVLHRGHSPVICSADGRVTSSSRFRSKIRGCASLRSADDPRCRHS